MNIEQYRAMKAEQERAKADAQTQRTDTPPSETRQAEATQVPNPTEPNTQPQGNGAVQESSTEKVVETPTTIEINGEQISIDELKNGYLRQSDYTKKTQEARRKEQQAEQALQLLEQIQRNPEVAQQLSHQIQMPDLDPRNAQFMELQNAYMDLYIQNELRSLHDRYGDFEDSEVLDIVMTEGIENIETAYHVAKSRKGGGQQSQPTLNVDEIKEQLRQELMNELKAQQEASVDTSSIIRSGGDSPVRDTTPQLSAQEIKVARMMGMNQEEYAKWRDIKNKK